ncbi:MAG TPA: magnesium transporter [Planctomycetota bacterium]|nr:magnesium transporter [Planctomycetota bacterium]
MLRATLERVAPEDVAAVLGELSSEQKLEVYRALGSVELQARVLEETDEESYREILLGSSPEERIAVVKAMPIDELAWHLEELSDEEQARVLAELDLEDRRDVKELLQYDPDTAGRMMTTEFLYVPVTASSREALNHIQGNLSAEFINYIYVVARNGKLRGVISIRDILKATPDSRVESYMEDDVVRVHVRTDREEVAGVVEKYGLQAVPVVDDGDRLRGIITFDDIFEAVQEENTEDFMRLAGTTSVLPLYEPVHSDVLKRLPFLSVTMIGGFLVATVLDAFKINLIGVHIFAGIIIWAQLVSALSGNVAVVTSTVMVRGLATGVVGPKRLRRAVIRELLVAIILSLAFAVVVSVAFWVYDRFKDPAEIAARGFGTWQAIAALGSAIVVSLGWSGLVGGTVPLLCRLLKIDPAIASGPFVTITCDLSASTIFLLFIAYVLGGSSG